MKGIEDLELEALETEGDEVVNGPFNNNV